MKQCICLTVVFLFQLNAVVHSYSVSNLADSDVVPATKIPDITTTTATAKETSTESSSTTIQSTSDSVLDTESTTNDVTEAETKTEIETSSTTTNVETSSTTTNVENSSTKSSRTTSDTSSTTSYIETSSSTSTTIDYSSSVATVNSETTDDSSFNHQHSEYFFGFISNETKIGIPSHSVTAYEMSASTCIDICGLLFYKIAVILDFQCVCTQRLFNQEIINCSDTATSDLRLCPGDSTEICGCTSANADWKAVYFIMTATYKVTLTRVQSVQSSVSVNIFNSENREIGPFLFNFDSYNGQTVKFSMVARLIDDIDTIRFGVMANGKRPKFEFANLNINVVNLNDTDDNFWNCSASLKRASPDATNTSLECSDNAFASNLVNKGDIYYCPFPGIPQKQIYYCSEYSEEYCDNFGNNVSLPFMRILAFDYCHDFHLTSAQIEFKSDCEALSLPDGVVEISRSAPTNALGTVVTIHCEWGYFNESGELTSRIFNATCKPYGQWSQIPHCYPVCFSEPPKGEKKVISDYNSNYVYLSNVSSVHYCCTSGMFGQLEFNQITVDCIGHGIWSMNYIPNCTNPIGTMLISVDVYCLYLLFVLLYCTQTKSLTVNEIESTFLNEFNRTKIREYLQYLTRNPHVSGSEFNNHLADHLAELWQNFGFDSVQKKTYEVLLSFPDEQNPNKVELLNERGQVVFASKHRETILRPEDDNENLIPIFNTYSPNGTAEGDLVYVNYGRPDDFKDLINLGVNFTGKIVIARYGEIFRGNKVYLAGHYGASAIILFNDPYQYAQEGEEPSQVYPNTKWLPGSAAQRGSVAIARGDPLTPQQPSIPNVYRLPIEDLTLPTIPCQPVGYDDAKQLLSRLGGLVVPEKWKDHSSSSFLIGPGFHNNTVAIKVRVSVHNQLKLTNITNVIGIIKGSIEPDRYVLAGNHRDAWGFGAVDASSGTAQMIEVSRIFGNLLERGWKPRRSIVFCSWDAEEFAVIGSFEWVEENLLKLTNRAVAYINTDSCVQGDLFIPNSSPFLADFFINATKSVPSPVNESYSLYETWLEDAYRYGSIDSNGNIKVHDLGGGTDHVPFFAFAGIPAINIFFDTDLLKEKRFFSAYPAYHTAYDTFYLIDNFVDPEYRRMGACGQLNLFLLYRLADANVIPFNVTTYRNNLINDIQNLRDRGIWDFLANNSANIENLEKIIQKFFNESKAWEDRLSNFNLSNPLDVRILNDQLMQLDKAFIKVGGVPLQSQYSHMVKSVSLHNMYGSSAFPGITDLLHEIIDHPLDKSDLLIQLEKHISDLIIAFHSAANFLKPLHEI
ncbi:hypothetical protein CHUAL_004882 [Chamberlinius hualienensis]